MGATLFDSEPDSILQELTDRDQLGNTDYFGVIIDAYKDGINGLGFLVTPAGVQFDLKYSALGSGGSSSFVQNGDTNWDAVWDAKAQRTDEGWSRNDHPLFRYSFPIVLTSPGISTLPGRCAAIGRNLSGIPSIRHSRALSISPAN
ncbi:MAG: hypothetical protein IPJ40_11455 [Saprospirales bacterium]|nr:hypothetical protein [Saprospirales bacterium]